MSKTQNEAFKALKIVESQIRRTHFVHSLGELSEEDQDKIRGLFTLWFAIWDEVLTASGCPWAKARWLNAICAAPVDYTLSLGKEADSLLLESVEYGAPHDYDSFKHCLKRAGFNDLLIVPEVKGLLVRWFDQWEPEMLKALRTLFRWPTKVNLTLPALQEKALNDYLDVERNLKLDGYTTEEAEVLKNWFPRESEDEFLASCTPHNGNGSVAQGPLTLAEKYHSFQYDKRLLWLLQHCYLDIQSWFPGLERTSKVQFVPKAFDKYRTISMEPAVLMYWQEGFFEAFRQMIEPGRPWERFRRRYDPSSQEPNRERALRGSIDGSLATIDLSSASDMIPWPLVKSWFKETAWRRVVLCTRSDYTVLPNGERIKLNKFAPMGCALTFPLETAIFAAQVECAIREFGGDPERSAYRVYGDDIVVESRYFEAVVSRLQRNGFKVNTEKSYHLGAYGFFRESCGVHAMNGQDVTPVICSRFFRDYGKRWLTASDVSAIIDQANTFYGANLRLARRLLVGRLLDLPQRLRPVFGPLGVWSDQPTNFHLRTVFKDTGYQTTMVQHGCAKPVKRRERDGEIELLEFLRQTRDRKEVVEPLLVNATYRRQEAAWGSTWTPAFILAAPEVGDLREIQDTE